MSTKEDNKKNDDAFELRRKVANAYGFVVGQQSNQSFAATTLEECIDRRIEDIEGTQQDGRPNILEEISRIENDFKSAVEKIRSLPPDYFKAPKDNLPVNTEEGQAEET